MVISRLDRKQSVNPARVVIFVATVLVGSQFKECTLITYYLFLTWSHEIRHIYSHEQREKTFY